MNIENIRLTDNAQTVLKEAYALYLSRENPNHNTRGYILDTDLPQISSNNFSSAVAELKNNNLVEARMRAFILNTNAILYAENDFNNFKNPQNTTSNTVTVAGNNNVVNNYGNIRKGDVHMLTTEEKELLIKISNNTDIDTNKYGIHIINLVKNGLVNTVPGDDNPFYAIMLTDEGKALVKSNFPEEYLKNYNSTQENNIINVSGNSNNINSTIINSFNNNDFSKFIENLNAVENSEAKELLLNISKSNKEELKHLLKNFKNAPDDIKENKFKSFIYDVGINIAPTMFNSLLELIKHIVI